MLYFQIFYDYISEEKIQNCLTKEVKNDINNTFASSDNIEKTDIENGISKKIICDNPLSAHHNYKIDDTKLEIEIRVIKKSFCDRFKRKIYNCSCLIRFSIILSILLFPAVLCIILYAINDGNK